MTGPEDAGPCRRCGITHKTWTARARCLMPDTSVPSGSGRWAVLHPLTTPPDFYPRPEVHLFETRAEADKCIASHDRGLLEGADGCCGSCIRARCAGYRQSVVDLASVSPWPKGRFRERPGITARRGLMS